MRMMLLNVPVYAESFNRFVEEREREVHSRIERADAAWQACGAGSAPPEKHLEIRLAVEDSWGPWEFNRVVGWFCITLHAGEIEVDVFEHASQRFTRNARLRYRVAERRATSLDESHPFSRDTGAWLLDALKELKHTHFKNRWVDWSSLGQLAKQIDWCRLMVRQD